MLAAGQGARRETRIAIVVAMATAVPKPRPMAIALMVPEARPISQPPESAGVPH